jgi:uncharacterized protein (DUF433 family)
MELRMRRLVSSIDQVATNIERFAKEINGNTEMQTRLGMVHDWYALKLASGRWAFGPSKFVGYRDNNMRKYLETYRADPKGTERALEPLSTEVAEGTKIESELTSALEEFLDQWGRKPRRGSRIRIVSDQDSSVAISSPQRVGGSVLNRISSDPRICGGRPCIKGTRMRVVDIVEAIAHGATREELLRDFDYLTAEDIAAALLYAARASDHRVVETA